MAVLDRVAARSENQIMRAGSGVFPSTRHVAAGVLICLLGQGVAFAQSLAELARQTRAERQMGKPASRIYTNDDLSPVPSPAPGAAKAEPGAPAADDPSAPPPAGNAGPAPEPAEVKDEAYWRKRVQAEREALRQAQMFVAALQSQVNGLWAEFTACQAPPQCNEIAQRRTQALAELDRVGQDVQQRTKAVADIQEEARRAGVPAGWVR